MATQTGQKSQCRHVRRSIRRHLSQMIQDVDALDKELIPISELEGMGFRPVQVGFHKDEVDFSPCFFKPLPASIIEEHPLTPQEPWYCMYPESLTENDGPRRVMEYACGKHSQVNWLITAHSRGIEIDEDDLGGPEGLETFTFLQEPTRLRRTPRYYLKLTNNTSPGSWRLADEYESWNTEYPHVGCCMVHGTYGTDQTLAIGEIKAILRILHSHYHDPEYRSHVILPILILSYLGQNGRIIQAHHDGEAMVVQYSPLMRLGLHRQGNDVEPIPFFVRYRVSRVVGLTIGAGQNDTQLCIR